MTSISQPLPSLMSQAYPLTGEQIEQYRRDGFVVIEDVLTGEALSAMRDAVAAAVEAEAADKGAMPGVSGHGGTYSQIFIQKVNLWQRHEAVRPFVLSRRFGDIAARLEGRPMRIWHDQALFKQPREGIRTPWHQDSPYWPHQSRRHRTTIWIALRDATIHNGCMSFIPGTHHLDELPPVRLAVPDDLFEWAPRYRGVKGQVRELRAGSCTFHNGLTFHYAGPNRSDAMREAFAIIYMPDGARFNGGKHIVTEPLNLQAGDEFEGETFPLVGEPGGDAL